MELNETSTVQEVIVYLADNNYGALTALTLIQELEDYPILYQALVKENIRGAEIWKIYANCDKDLYRFFSAVTGMRSLSEPEPKITFWYRLKSFFGQFV